MRLSWFCPTFPRLSLRIKLPYLEKSTCGIFSPLFPRRQSHCSHMQTITARVRQQLQRGAPAEPSWKSFCPLARYRTDLT